MRTALLFFCLGAFLAAPTLAAVSCLDTNGKPVDWFFSYKMGSPVGEYGGYTYAYWDSNGVYFDNGNLNKSNAMMYTVNQMYQGGNIGYVMYNDQSYDTIEQRDSGRPSNHEKDQNGNPVAHQKGDLIFDGQNGVWLLHSVPGFPLSHKIRYDGYPMPNWVYLHSQAFYGQTFYCMSVSASTIDMLAGLLQYSYPWIYDSNVPSALKSSFPNVQQLISGKFISTASNGTFSTLGGVQHVVFQKNGATDSDLYEDYVAPGLQTGLKTETWCGGLDGFQCMPSFCAGAPITNPSGPQQHQKKYKYDSINSQELHFADNLWFTNKYDHAKFAMAYNGAQPPAQKWFCPADINRMKSQRARGGGAACSINPTLWDALNKIITRYDKACETKTHQ